jgi:hypothetical protein
MKKIKTFTRSVGVVALGIASLSLGYGDTLCPIAAPVTLSSIGVGAAGSGVSGSCSLGGGILFSNISLAGSSSSGTGTAGAIDPTLVNIQFTGSGNILNVVLTDPTGWSLSGTQQFDLVLSYTMTGGAWFVSFGNNFDGSATTNGVQTGAISFDKTAIDGASPAQDLPTLSLGFQTNPQTIFTGTPAPPLSTINIVDNIQVHATNQTATLNSATNSFVIPEPMTSMLLGSGLLAFGLMLRRKRN